MSVTAKSVVQRNKMVRPRSADELPRIPITQRQSLPPDQRYGTRTQVAVRTRPPIDADVLEDEEEGPLDRRTDDLVEDVPITRALQGTKVRSYVPSEPKSVGWIKVLLVAIVVVIVGWGVVSGVLALISWGTDVVDTYHYGPTRTSEVSGIFLKDDTSLNQTSVIATNVRGVIFLAVLPGGDTSKAKTYPTGLTLMGDDAAKLPVILTVKDVNGDHRPDVVVEIPGKGVTLELINTGTGFTLTKQGS